MSIIKLNSSNFNEEILNKRTTSIVDFYADWCGPCKMIAPILEEISKERDDIIIGKINVDDNFELAAKYNVSSIPTIIIFKDGNEVNRIVGYRPKEDILDLI